MSGPTRWCSAPSRSTWPPCCWAARRRCCRPSPATCCTSAPQGFGLLRSATGHRRGGGGALPGRPARSAARAGLIMFAGVARLRRGDRRLRPLAVAVAVGGRRWRCWAAADMLSVFVRQTLVQLVTPDAMRGRVAAVSTLFISRLQRAGRVRERPGGAVPRAGGRGGVRRRRRADRHRPLGAAVSRLAQGRPPRIEPSAQFAFSIQGDRSMGILGRQGGSGHRRRQRHRPRLRADRGAGRRQGAGQRPRRQPRRRRRGLGRPGRDGGPGDPRRRRRGGLQLRERHLAEGRPGHGASRRWTPSAACTR